MSGKTDKVGNKNCLKIESLKLVLKFSDKLPKKITVNLYLKNTGIILLSNNLINY